MKILSVKSFFEKVNFSEALLMKCYYKEKQQKFVLEAILVNFSLPKSHREFHKLVFKNINDYKLEKGANKLFSLDPFSYKTLDYSGHIYIYTMKLIDLDKIEIYLGSSHGCFEFTFDSLFHSKRIGLGKSYTNEITKYFDVKTGEEFDFYNPFLPE